MKYYVIPALASVFYGLGNTFLWGINALSSAISKIKPGNDNNNKSNVDLITLLKRLPDISPQNTDVDNEPQANTFLPSHVAPPKNDLSVYANQFNDKVEVVPPKGTSKPGLK